MPALSSVIENKETFYSYIKYSSDGYSILY